METDDKLMNISIEWKQINTADEYIYSMETDKLMNGFVNGNRWSNIAMKKAILWKQMNTADKLPYNRGKEEYCWWMDLK